MKREATELGQTADYWIGRLSMTMALCLEKKRTSGEIHRMLRRVLAEFMVSPVSTEELRDHLRRYL